VQLSDTHLLIGDFSAQKFGLECWRGNNGRALKQRCFGTTLMELTSLSGKAGLVTGAADGVGAEIARLYAEHGAAMVLGDVAADKAKRPP